MQLRVCHLRQRIVVILKAGLILYDGTVVFQGYSFIGTVYAKVTLYCNSNVDMMLLMSLFASRVCMFKP